MSLFIPIVILALALVGIGLIAVRKFVYLKKLTPEAISDPSPTWITFWGNWIPEIVIFFKSIRWREHRVTLMAESEKLLRRIRLFVLKIDIGTHSLINRLRRSTKHHEAILVKEEEQKIVEEAEIALPPVVTLDPKEEEQHLIMEIAKNPKDPLLYRRLGDVYIKTGDIENAKMSFETVLELDPKNWYAKKKLAGLAQR